MSSAIMDVPTGIMSDRIGRKKTLAIGSLAAATGIACYAMATGFIGLLAGAVLCGISTCLFNGNNNALLYETLKAEGKQEAYHHYQGRISSMFQLALGLAAICSSPLATHGLRIIFALGIIPQLFAVLVSLFFVEPRIHQPSTHHDVGYLKQALRQAWRNGRLRWLIFGQAISYGAGEATFNFRNIFINQLWPLWALGIYRACNNVGGFLGFWFSGRLIDRLKPSRILMISEVYWTATTGTAILLANIFSPVLFMTGALFYGPYTIAIDKLMQDEFTDRERATMGSLTSFTGSVFYTIMAFAIGLVSDAYGVATGLGVGIAVATCALPIYMRLFKRYF